MGDSIGAPPAGDVRGPAYPTYPDRHREHGQGGLLQLLPVVSRVFRVSGPAGGHLLGSLCYTLDINKGGRGGPSESGSNSVSNSGEEGAREVDRGEIDAESGTEQPKQTSNESEAQHREQRTENHRT